MGLKKKFRLKEEVRPLVEKEFSLRIEPIDFWEKHMFRADFLEEVDGVYVTYGHASEDGNTTHRGRWSSSTQTSQIFFTLHLPEFTNKDNDKLGDSIPELMSRINQLVRAHVKTIKAGK